MFSGRPEGVALLVHFLPICSFFKKEKVETPPPTHQVIGDYSCKNVLQAEVLKNPRKVLKTSLNKVFFFCTFLAKGPNCCQEN
jgi:hypothetical protein